MSFCIYCDVIHQAAYAKPHRWADKDAKGNPRVLLLQNMKGKNKGHNPKTSFICFGLQYLRLKKVTKSTTILAKLPQFWQFVSLVYWWMPLSCESIFFTFCLDSRDSYVSPELFSVYKVRIKWLTSVDYLGGVWDNKKGLAY